MPATLALVDTSHTHWCQTCERVCEGPECTRAGHDTRRIGRRVAIDCCVLDRRHAIDPTKVGFMNNVGHALGRTASQQERHTAEQIAAMRTRDIQTRRALRMAGQDTAGTRVGAIPSALLFSLKRQYGQDYLQKAKELMKREGLWWGEN